MSNQIHVTVWNEGRHEKSHKEVADVYPNGIHTVIADGLQEAGFFVRTATLDEVEHGLPESVLKDTDVLIWWGHMAHGEVSDVVVERVYKRVMEGMGLIVLHSGHFSKIFKRLMGSSCELKWREVGEKERLWVVEPGHPITDGLGDYFEIPHEEMYGERFDIPAQIPWSSSPGTLAVRSSAADAATTAGMVKCSTSVQVMKPIQLITSQKCAESLRMQSSGLRHVVGNSLLLETINL